MKRSLICMVRLFFCFLYNGQLHLGLAEMDNDEGFFKRIMLREVMKECEEDKLLNYLAKLQTVNPESIINLASVKDLKSFCSDLDANVKEMNNYLNTCTPPHQKNLYFDLIRGIQALDDKLCKDNNFQQGFMKYTECFEKLSEEYKQCAGPADWIENPDEEHICKVYKDIADCYYVKTSLLCGSEKADKFKELLMSVIDNILRVRCNGISDIPQMPDVLHERQSALTGKTGNTFSLIPVFAIISIVIFVIVVYTTSRCLKNKNDEKKPKKKCSKTNM